MNRTDRRIKTSAGLLIILSGLVLAACGESSKGTSTSPAPSASTSSTGASTTTATTPTANAVHSAVEAHLVAFRECMKKNGITLAPTVAGQSLKLPSGATPKQYEAASKKCQVELGTFEPPTGGAKPISSAARRVLVKLAACLREHGINLPPSTPSRPLYYPSGLNLSSPQFKAAELKCFPLASGSG